MIYTVAVSAALAFSAGSHMGFANIGSQPAVRMQSTVRSFAPGAGACAAAGRLRALCPESPGRVGGLEYFERRAEAASGACRVF